MLCPKARLLRITPHSSMDRPPLEHSHSEGAGSRPGCRLFPERNDTGEHDTRPLRPLLSELHGLRFKQWVDVWKHFRMRTIRFEVCFLLLGFVTT